MTLAAIGAIALRVLATVVNVLGLANLIHGYLDPNDPASPAARILSNTSLLVADVESASIGLAKIIANQAIIEASIAALGAPQSSTLPVILPTTPPTGYGTGGLVNAIWAYIIPSTTIRADDSLAAAAAPGLLEAPFGSLKAAYFPGGWSVGGDWSFSAQPAPDNNRAPPLDPGTILVGDLTPLDWVNRVQPGWGVTAGEGGHPEAYQTGSSWTWVYWMGFAEFAQYKAAVFGASSLASPAAPVWPGIALVTLGTPVALSEALTIAELMDGVIIELTSVPSQRGFYGYDDVKVYQNIGALVFVDDNSDVEGFQAIGATFGVYSPRSMVRASAVKIRGGPGVSGTVTPWLITP